MRENRVTVLPSSASLFTSAVIYKDVISCTILSLIAHCPARSRGKQTTEDTYLLSDSLPSPVDPVVCRGLSIRLSEEYVDPLTIWASLGVRGLTKGLIEDAVHLCEVIRVSPHPMNEDQKMNSLGSLGSHGSRSWDWKGTEMIRRGGKEGKCRWILDKGGGVDK